MTRAIRTLVLPLLLACLLLPAAALAQTIELAAPKGIDIGAFYNGTTLTAEGAVPAGSQVVLRFVGQPAELAMKQKGKALGLLWMNRNTLHFAGVPKVFLVQSSAPLEGLGKAGADLGLAGLAGKIGLEPETPEHGVLLSELVTLKKNEGLYREGATGLTLGAAEGASQRFSAQLAIPSRLSPGAYTLEVFAVKDGVVVAQGAHGVEVRLEGMPALMADLAFNHALWYGVLASVIAILAGLGIGMVFQSKGAH